MLLRLKYRTNQGDNYDLQACVAKQKWLVSIQQIWQGAALRLLLLERKAVFPFKCY